ncbi:hypothetical protein RND81_08G092200 [Saponaria officinalis]|uniref:CDT1 Geminin-binding domain-containing protein n=1 Tax=Saponaria officinalis TaxID=3572 RepID=A0AAW1J7Y5_SAPOF
MQSSIIDFSLSTPIKSTRQSSPSSTSPVVSTPDRVNPPIQSQTRTSTQVKSHRRKVQPFDQSQLTQKYEKLCELFNALVSSIRFLQLRRVPTSLTNLSRSIESLTERRFTSDHLAQLKHIIPETIVVEKVRIQDKETRCMKEDLLISLEINNQAKGNAGYSHLRTIFRTRITNYSTIHPEGNDVPKSELPKLFYKLPNEIEPRTDHISELLPNTLTDPSFKRHFSHGAITKSLISRPLVSKISSKTPVKDANSTQDNDTYLRSETYINATPVKCISTPTKFAPTPPTFSSTPARLMTATPELNMRKRSLISDDNASDDLPKKSLKRRALKFDKLDVQVDKDLQDVLPANLLHSLIIKERRLLEEQDPVVSQARRRQVLIFGVPKLLCMIQLLFQSVGRSVMTKEELVQKLIVGNLDIVDKSEIEEQLKLLQELAPEFITEQSCFGGDTLLRVNKFSCVDSIRSKILEAR